MSIHLSEAVVEGLPQEPKLLRHVNVRLIEPSKRSRFDALLTREHYLKNATVVGQALRCVAEYEGQWLALLAFSSLALFLYEQQRGKRGGKKSLPDFERRVGRQPAVMIRRFMSALEGRVKFHFPRTELGGVFAPARIVF